VLQHQPHRPLPQPLRVPRRACHLSILSTNGVSNLPGAVQSHRSPDCGANSAHAWHSALASTEAAGQGEGDVDSAGRSEFHVVAAHAAVPWRPARRVVTPGPSSWST